MQTINKQSTFHPFELHLLHVEIYFTDKNKELFFWLTLSAV